MSTFCPAWIFAFLRKCNAENPPNKTAAASSNVILTGFIASVPSSGRQAYSAWAPSLRPVPPNTSSPSRNLVTAWPTDSTLPANSTPSMLIFVGLQRPLRNLMRNGSAFLSLQSAAQTVAAWIRTRTSLSLGTGFSTSSIWRTSGGPYLR
jgi:hypothetical protein